MEQLIIFLLFVVGSIISSVIQHKKKKAEEQQQRELEELTRTPRGQGAPPPVKPQPAWPKTAGDWQEQLRRMLEGESAPPVIKPVIKPVLLPPQQKAQAPQQSRSSKAQIPPAHAEIPVKKVGTQRSFKLTESQYERASNLHANVQERMRSIRKKTTTHAPTAFNRARPLLQSDVVRNLRRSRTAIREAFIASLIFAPPKAVESGEIESAR